MAETQDKPNPTSDDWKALNAIINKANDGDQEALTKLRNFLDNNPQVWGHVGDLSRTAEKAWVGLISNGDSLAAESIQRKLTKLKEELLDDSVTVIEKMLADTVVATWLELHYLRSVDADTTNRTVTQGSLILKRLESAQRRHFNSLKQLTQIRKLLPNRGEIPGLRLFPQREQMG